MILSSILILLVVFLMVNDNLGLGELRRYAPATVRAREAQHQVKFLTGEELLIASGRMRIGIRGDSYSGKTHTLFSMLEHRIENLASDENWILKMFSHQPGFAEHVLECDLDERRSLLMKSHKVICIDFDNRGMEELMSGWTANPIIIKNTVQYFGVESWEEAIAATKQGMEVLREHESQGWSRLGCWIVMDNMGEAWSEVQNDWVTARTGVTQTEMQMMIRARHPGVDDIARSTQSEEIAKNMDWPTINKMHKEWFAPVLNTGYNVMVMGPTKWREEEVDTPTGREKKEIAKIAGIKKLMFDLDFVLAKYIDRNTGVRTAEFDKIRFTGIKPNRIIDPTWQNIENEINRVMAIHINRQKEKFAKRTYANKISFDLSKFIKGDVDLTQRTEYDFGTKLPIPEPQYPTPDPITQGEKLGLGALPPPPPMPMPTETQAADMLKDMKDLAATLPDTQFGVHGSPEGLPTTLPLPPAEEDDDDDFGAPPLPAPAPEPEPSLPLPSPTPLPDPKPGADLIVHDVKSRLLELIRGEWYLKFQGEKQIVIDFMIDEMVKTGVTEADVDNALTELLDDGVLFEPTLGGVWLVNEPDLVPLPSPPQAPETPSLPLPEPPQEEEEEDDRSRCQFCGEMVTTVDGNGMCVDCQSDGVPPFSTFVVSALDHGRGKYHLPSCSRLEKIKKTEETRDPGNRGPCKTCKPPSADSVTWSDEEEPSLPEVPAPEDDPPEPDFDEEDDW